MRRRVVLAFAGSVLAAGLAVEPRARDAMLHVVVPVAAAQADPAAEDEPADDDADVDDGDLDDAADGALDAPADDAVDDPVDDAVDEPADAPAGADDAPGADAVGGDDDTAGGDDAAPDGGDDAPGGGGDDDARGGDDDARGGDDDTRGGDDDGRGGDDSDDRDEEPESGRDLEDESRDGDAERFELGDDEFFDEDGYLAKRSEIVALSADPALPERAARLGLTVASRESLAGIDRALYRLRVPAQLAIDGLLARLRAAEPEGAFDYNHIYAEANSRRGDVRPSPRTSGRALAAGAKAPLIGLIDTGVDVRHPALRQVQVEQRRFASGQRADSTEHGTAVASLLAGPHGLVPSARLLVASVFYDGGDGEERGEAVDLVRALGWMMERNVAVVNMSLAGPPNAVLQAALDGARRSGHLVVAAVGNGGPAAPPSFPAAYDSVVAVTAVGDDLRVYRRANRGGHVYLSAPGVGVEAAAPGGYATYSGTSFASPYVAALGALALERPDADSVDRLLYTLSATALDLGAPGRDAVYGFGLARPPSGGAR